MAYINRELTLELLKRNSITEHITLSDGVSIYDTIANIPIAEEAPQNVVENLRKRLKKTEVELMNVCLDKTNCDDMIQYILDFYFRERVAEVFKEIELLIEKYAFEPNYCMQNMEEDIASLKKNTRRNNMPRYIDADAAVEQARLNYCKGCYSYNGVMCRACVFDDTMSFIEDYPAADVVPKSELAIISVQNAALENTKNELLVQLALSEAAKDMVKKSANAAIEIAKQKVAREIFGEIDKIAMPYATPLGNCAMSVGIVSYELLKKKYTEGNQ